jgi:hypothetical protein
VGSEVSLGTQPEREQREAGLGRGKVRQHWQFVEADSIRDSGAGWPFTV